MQSRRSLLTWKIFGRRLDGFHNDDHPSEPTPGAGYLEHQGQRYDKRREWYDIDFVGQPMPPPEALAGTFQVAVAPNIVLQTPDQPTDSLVANTARGNDEGDDDEGDDDD